MCSISGTRSHTLAPLFLLSLTVILSWLSLQLVKDLTTLESLRLSRPLNTSREHCISFPLSATFLHRLHLLLSKLPRIVMYPRNTDTVAPNLSYNRSREGMLHRRCTHSTSLGHMDGLAIVQFSFFLNRQQLGGKEERRIHCEKKMQVSMA